MPLETEEILQEGNKRREGLSQAEDLTLKSAAAYFGDEMMRWLGVRENGAGALTRDDVIPLLFSPLMGGRSEQKERILRGIRILKTGETAFPKEDVRKMEAILYAFAVKFLDRQEIRAIKEEMAMTILGQMIWDDALEKGMEKGRKEESERYSRLILKLNEEGKTDLLVKTASDPEYRETLYKEYGI